MHISLRNTGVFVAWQSLLTGVLADFSGPSFPGPKDLTSDQSIVKTAWEGLKVALEAHLDGNATGNSSSPLLPQRSRNITFSIGLFSIHNPKATSLQFHHTSPEVVASTQGTNKADSNSIYRVASVTKVFTVLAGLLSLTDADWERPLSKILTPLSKPSKPDVLTTPWDKITMRSLAAQIAGVPRDGFPSGAEIAVLMNLRNQSEAELMALTGLPPLISLVNNPLVAPPCSLSNDECLEVPYLQGVANRAPTFSPWSTPAYANNGFTLLGMAMANVTKQSMGRLYEKNILDPLCMSSIFADPPPKNLYPRSVIVAGNEPAYPTPNGIFVSSGGVFSTTADLAKLGTGILDSSLLSPEQTHRWLKPVSHTARWEYSVGAPWEIIRFRHPKTNKITDLYTKLGDAGLYSSWLVLIPDYGVGFSILSAGSSGADRFNTVATLSDRLTQTLVPALHKQAALEAGQNFGGRYTTAKQGLNSSLVLRTIQDGNGSPTAEGLVIESWISNGTDVLPYMAQILGPGPHRLLPSISMDDKKGGKVAFRVVSSRDSPAAGSGSDSSSEMTPLFAAPGMEAPDWLVVDATTYYGYGLSLFVFDVGRDGKATAVTMPAYRATLRRST